MRFIVVIVVLAVIIALGVALAIVPALGIALANVATMWLRLDLRFNKFFEDYKLSVANY